MSRPDLDEIGRCPVGRRCEQCGADPATVSVRTYTTALGVLCLTVCPRCARSDTEPRVAVGTAARLVGQHCEHLGIDLDEMAAAMRDEEGEPR